MENIPDSVEDILMDEELREIENRDGWAFGTVVLMENREQEDKREEVLIELMPDFGGVKFFAEEDNELGMTESYAYATKEAFDRSSKEVGWYVESFDAPPDSDFGKPAP